MRAGSAVYNVTADEDYAAALRAAENADCWDDGEHRLIVMIPDNPAHANVRHRATAAARCFARRSGVRQHCLGALVDMSMTAGADHPDAPAFMQRVARADDSRFVRAHENASPSVTILRPIFDQ